MFQPTSFLEISGSFTMGRKGPKAVDCHSHPVLSFTDKWGVLTEKRIKKGKP